MSRNLKTPGVYRQDTFREPMKGFETGVPVFLGFVDKKPKRSDEPIALWTEFRERFGDSYTYLSDAVHGFFANGGRRCFVVGLSDASPQEALEEALERSELLDAVDLVCAPDIMHPQLHAGHRPDQATVFEMQRAILDHCTKMRHRFAILDGLFSNDCTFCPETLADDVSQELSEHHGSLNAAWYFPWIRVRRDSPADSVPPCGHLAGIYAQTDHRVGVHGPPANEPLEDVLDVDVHLEHPQQATLNPAGINAIRVFPGRGIRVWGARTLTQDNETWRDVNVRRVFLTTRRWLEEDLVSAVFEPNDHSLWSFVRRELNVYLDRLFRQGALHGETANDAYYVKCDAETNNKDARDAGMLVAEMGMAAVRPNEFIVIRLLKGDERLSITTPSRL